MLFRTEKIKFNKHEKLILEQEGYIEVMATGPCSLVVHSYTKKGEVIQKIWSGYLVNGDSVRVS